MCSPAKYERLSHKAQALQGLNCFGELVLLRTDFNVPLSNGPKGELSVSDATRIDAALPTVRLLLGKGAKLVIVSHLGRPQPNKASLSALRLTHGLNPVFSVLKERLGAETVSFVDSCVGPVADTAIAQLQSGQVSLSSKRVLVKDVEARPVVSKKTSWDSSNSQTAGALQLHWLQH